MSLFWIVVIGAALVITWGLLEAGLETRPDDVDELAAKRAKEWLRSQSRDA